MTFVTTLELESGDRRALDSVVADIKETVERKGAEFKGPHTPPPETLAVPLYDDLERGGHFDSWSYTVYTRTVEIVGHDELASSIATRSFPDQVHVEADVRSIQQSG
ncbi:ribosomal protein S10 [Salinarchaeum sp. Harcht-Bsk1]|uniref:uS10/mL48 family ribosomal protein n=1 Tax=Salinarchaeum sp. Harcht-Bsk1 TaxID=1333523 RepID=UPI0003423391|nr:uS10/mL48 family ribosomal protein [Salinarchaeum sp. Harcht-Bsk1]AGN00102.1 ribosomal protein S10 [Salinarchaeum sp. Harcht-Bsk1]